MSTAHDPGYRQEVGGTVDGPTTLDARPQFDSARFLGASEERLLAPTPRSRRDTAVRRRPTG